MSTESIALIVILTYKLVTLFSGTLIIYMGYRLFTEGLFSEAGHLDGRFGQHRILLKRAAPGTFFALFGALVLLVSIVIGFDVDSENRSREEQTPEITSPAPEPQTSTLPPVPPA